MTKSKLVISINFATSWWLQLLDKFVKTGFIGSDHGSKFFTTRQKYFSSVL